MKKINYLQVIFLLNSIFYIIINNNKNFMNLDTWMTLWSWTIWIHLIINIILLTDIFMNRYIRVILKICQYFILILFTHVYILCYSLNLFDISKEVIVYILCICLVGMCILNFICLKERDDTPYERIQEYSKLDVEEYIKGLIMNWEYRKQSDVYIGVVIANMISFILMMFIPLVMRSLLSFIGMNSVFIGLMIIINLVYILISYFKYRVMNMTLFMFFIETFLSLIGMLTYINFADTILQGLPIILMTAVFFFPYCIRCYQISLRYHMKTE